MLTVTCSSLSVYFHVLREVFFELRIVADYHVSRHPLQTLMESFRASYSCVYSYATPYESVTGYARATPAHYKGKWCTLQTMMLDASRNMLNVSKLIGNVDQASF